MSTSTSRHSGNDARSNYSFPFREKERKETAEMASGDSRFRAFEKGGKKVNSRSSTRIKATTAAMDSCQPSLLPLPEKKGIIYSPGVLLSPPVQFPSSLPLCPSSFLLDQHAVSSLSLFSIPPPGGNKNPTGHKRHDTIFVTSLSTKSIYLESGRCCACLVVRNCLVHSGRALTVQRRPPPPFFLTWYREPRINWK